MRRETIYPEGWQETRGIYSPAIKVSIGSTDLIFVSGQQARKDGDNTVSGSAAEQTEDIFRQISETLKAAGANLDDVMKVQIFLTDMNDFDEVSKVRDKYFANNRPTSTLLEVNAMTRRGAKVEIEATALKERI